MNVTRSRSQVQGRFPKLRAGTKYRQTLEALFIEAARMTGSDPLGVASVLQRHKINAVFIGGLTVGCLSGRPRATRDIDLIAGDVRFSKKVLQELGTVVDSKKIERHPSFLSFIRRGPAGDHEVLDIITSQAGSYRLVFANAQKLQIGKIAISIPTAEMMVVLKYTAAVNPVRPKTKKMQDWADLFAVVDATPGIKMPLIRHLADEVVPGFGDDLAEKIKTHRK